MGSIPKNPQRATVTPIDSRRTESFFAAIPMRAIQDKRLKLTHWRVLAAIANADQFGKNGHHCFASHSRIAEWSATTRPLVTRTIHELIDFGYLATEEVAGRNTYRVLYVDGPEDVSHQIPNGIPPDTTEEGRGIPPDTGGGIPPDTGVVSHGIHIRKEVNIEAEEEAADEGTDIVIPLKDGTQWSPDAHLLSVWRKAYRNIDVVAELARCASWNESNEAKRKTRNGIKRHVNLWLSDKDHKATAQAAEVNEREARIVWG
ncbi:helix-turn-helix domain-containing protein [Lentisalinibacter orientalis]|uniref:helix-turn-helix domain-containing protein n=1 Tax=Lentisalinibacter orientalis TaxID=2992241 RepID=UPI0038631EFD